MDRFQQLFNMPGMGGGGGAPDAPVVDTAEKLHISSLALLKMLKHGEYHTIRSIAPTLLCFTTPHFVITVATTPSRAETCNGAQILSDITQ